MFFRMGAGLPADSAKPATRTTGLQNSSRGYPHERQPDAGLFIQLPLQLPHERRQTGTAFALKPLGLQD